nr:hypothetical protein [Tanacetum cinerariifolium]
MVKTGFGGMMEEDIKDMTIVVYMEYEAEMKRRRNSRSYFYTKYEDNGINSFHNDKSRDLDYPHHSDDSKFIAYYDLPPLLPFFKHVQPQTKYTYEPIKDDTNYISKDESKIGEQMMINHTDDDKPFTPKPQTKDGELSSDKDLDDWLKMEMEKHMCGKYKENEEDAMVVILKSLVSECKAVYANKGAQIETSSDGTNKLPPKELNPRSFNLPCTIGSVNLYAITDLGASVNIMPRSDFKHLKLANLKKTDMLVDMAAMSRKFSLGIVKMSWYKINKFLFPSDHNYGHKFLVESISSSIRADLLNVSAIQSSAVDGLVVADGLLLAIESNLTARKFLVESISSSIRADLLNVSAIQSSAVDGIREDMVLFDMDGSVSHSNIPVEKVYIMWPTCNPDLSFYSGYNAIYGKGENGMLEQWMCLRDHKRQTIGGKRMKFADFLKVLAARKWNTRYVLWKPSRDFTRPLGPPSGLKGLLHMLNATVIPTKQASSSGTQTDSTPIYDSDGSAEVHENYDNDKIFNMFTQEEQYTELLEPIPEPQQVPQNDNHVISEVTDLEQDEKTVEQHSANFEETCALYESLYQKLSS